MKYIWPIREHVVKRTRVECFRRFRALGFCKINCGFFGEQKVFCQTLFTNMATKFVKITDDDVEILTEREENENTRKKPPKLCRTFVGKHETSCFT